MDEKCKKIIIDALNEDLMPCGDITSESIINSEHKSKFSLIANEDAVLAGVNVFKEIVLYLDQKAVINLKYSDSQKINKKTVVSEISGNTIALLKAERTALNFISHLSGISTLTRELVDLIRNTGVKLLDTRKTTPNLRTFEREAVSSGGASNHRFNLSDMVLVKDNHIAIAGSVAQAMQKIRKSSLIKKVKIEIEVKTINELKEALPYKPDVIMFDNWDISHLKEAVKLVPDNILTEASGLINKENIKDYAMTGVNYISTSFMIKNSKWIDFSFKAN